MAKGAKELADDANATTKRVSEKAFEAAEDRRKKVIEERTESGERGGGKFFTPKGDSEKVHGRATVTIPEAADRGHPWNRKAYAQHLPRKDWNNPQGSGEQRELLEDFTVTGSTSPEGGQTVAEARSGGGRYSGYEGGVGAHWDHMKLKWTEKLTGTSHAPLELANTLHQLHDLQQKIPDLLDGQPELKADLEEFVRYDTQPRTTPGGEHFGTQEELLEKLEDE